MAAGSAKIVDAQGNATLTPTIPTGDMLTESTDRLGNTVWRSYGAENELLTEARKGSNAEASDALQVTRFVYNTPRNSLRWFSTKAW